MKDYIKGIIGGIIGGIIALLPWILMYIYGGYILSILAALIAMGVKIGYTKLNGKIDKKFPYIIAITSISLVVIATLVVIPLLLLQKEGFLANFANLQILYQNEKFMGGLIGDLIISILFAILGISGVIKSTKKEVGIETPLSKTEKLMQERVAYMKSKFERKNAFSKKTAISKEEIIDNEQDKKIFNNLKWQQIICKYKGKYYFSTKAESNALYRFAMLYFKLFGIIIIMIIVMLVIF